VAPSARGVRDACGHRDRRAQGDVAQGSSAVAGWALFLHDENDGNTGGPPDKGNGTDAYRWHGAMMRRRSLVVRWRSLTTVASGGRRQRWRAPEAPREGGEFEVP
jgi:hypothetical protein